MSIGLELVKALNKKFEADIKNKELLDNAEDFIRNFFEAIREGLKDVISVSNNQIIIDTLSPEISVIAEMKVFDDTLIFERNNNSIIDVWHINPKNKKEKISELIIKEGRVFEKGIYTFNEASLDHFIKRVFGKYLEEMNL